MWPKKSAELPRHAKNITPRCFHPSKGAAVGERETSTLETSFVGMCTANPRELSRWIKYIGNRGQQDFGSVQIQINFPAWPLHGAVIFMFHIMLSA
jgi:hypothetical protein